MKNRAFTLIEGMIIVCIIGLLVAIAVPAYQKIYNEVQRQQKQRPTPDEALEEAKQCHQPLRFSEIIYYFPQVHLDFPQTLKSFLDSHPGLEVSAIAPDVVKQGRFDSAYGEAVGYTVVFRKKP
ncbi:MAG: hypothetical protein ABSF56_02870 [Minisyncoccia bacterium]|jgi:hypothetical protein